MYCRSSVITGYLDFRLVYANYMSVGLLVFVWKGKQKEEDQTLIDESMKLVVEN